MKKVAIVLIVIAISLLVGFYAYIEWGLLALLITYATSIGIAYGAWAKWLDKTERTKVFLIIVIALATLAAIGAYSGGNRFGGNMVDIITQSK